MRIITGKENIRQNFPSILQDESHYCCGVPEKVFFPESSSDLQFILKEANSSAVPVVFIGAQTGTTGGAVPTEDCVAVCFSSMNRINSIKWFGETPVLYCDPGVTLLSINQFLQSPRSWPYHVDGVESIYDHRYMYPPDPTEYSAQLGGTVATNASGARSFRFGSTRNFVSALDIVMATGEKLEIFRGDIISDENFFKMTTDLDRTIQVPYPTFIMPQTKNASGYFSKPSMDLIDLLIGSEGTLAAFSQIGIRLIPEIHIISGMSFFEDSDSAFDFADFLRQESQVVSIEYFDANSLALVSDNPDRLSERFPDYPTGKKCAVFWEFMENQPDSFESKFELWENRLSLCGSSFDCTWSGFDLAERERLRRFRHAIPELINSLIARNKIDWPSIRKVGTDTAIPASLFRTVYKQYIDLIKKRQLASVSFGHLGDYHLHINIIPFNATELDSALEVYREIMEVTVRNNGTISAEHGIGKIKKEFFHRMYDEDAICQMKTIKRSFDPQGILNRGNLF
jgi:D-lactate dehydrogenase (cytochrome)